MIIRICKNCGHKIETTPRFSQVQIRCWVCRHTTTNEDNILEEKKMSEMKARHWAALSTFIILIASIAIVSVVSTLKDDPKPEKIGSFEFEGTKTEIIQAGRCQVYVTKWLNQPEPRFFFSCDNQ